MIDVQLTPDEYNYIQMVLSTYNMWVVVAIIGIIAVLAMGISWFVFERWFTPKESKYLRTATRRKRATMLLGGDDGYADLVEAHKSRPQGVLETKPKGKPKRHWTGFIARSVNQDKIDAIEVSEGKNVEITKRIAEYLASLSSRRLFLRHAKIPLWLAYRGKAVLVSLYGLVGLQVVEGLVNAATEANNPSESVGANSSGDNALSTVASKASATGFAAIDLVALKKLFPSPWDESQINAQEEDSRLEGYSEAKKFGGKDTIVLVVLLMIVLLIIFGIIMAATYFFFGGGGAV